MAGKKQRYKVRFEDGTIRTVEAQGYDSAKRIFIIRYRPPKGTWLEIWPQGSPEAARRKRV